MTKMELWAALPCLLLVSPLAGQEPPAPTPEGSASKPGPRAEASRARPSIVPLRVQITIARFEGEKKVSSLPFTLLVNASEAQNLGRPWAGIEGGPMSLRMGIEVPVRVTAQDKDGKTGSSYQYRSVGTNIDCKADALEDGRFRLDTRVEQSSLSPSAEKATQWAADLPFFRTFNTSFRALLRDGQSATHVVATDSLSAETVRIDVAIAVVR